MDIGRHIRKLRRDAKLLSHMQNMVDCIDIIYRANKRYEEFKKARSDLYRGMIKIERKYDYLFENGAEDAEGIFCEFLYIIANYLEKMKDVY